MDHNTTSPVKAMQGASLAQFLTTLGTSAAIAAVEIMIFVFIRTRFKRIYEPKTYLGAEERRVNPLPRSLFGWLPVLLKMPQEDLIRTSGFDAYFFARYLYIHGFFFLSAFVLLAIILLPIYTVGGKGESGGKKGLDLLTFGNIALSSSARYIAPLVLAYVFIGAFLYILYQEMKVFVEKRQALLRSPAYQSHSSATTILVTAIPKPYLSQDILSRIFNQLPGGVKYIWLNRNPKDLPDKVDERTKLVEQLETAECKMIKAAFKHELKHRKKNNTEAEPVAVEEGIVNQSTVKKERPMMRLGPIPLLSSLCLGEKVDTINHCRENISKLNTEIEAAQTNPDDDTLMNSAFIQFNKPLAAHVAAQSVIGSIPLTLTPCYMDVKPANIVWGNLTLTYYELKVRQLAMLGATATLIIFWAIPVSFVGILSNLKYLTTTFTFLEFIDDLPPSIVGLISGLLPTVLLAILMALLPIILTLFAKISGIPTTDRIDRYVQGSYFVFQVVHVFLFVSISGSVASVAQDIINDPSSVARILASNIPTASNFFFNFLALQGLSIAAGLLLQIGTLALFYLLGKLFDNTPRKKWTRRSTLTSLNWGTIFPVFTNYVVITLVYSIIAPVMLIISGLAFALFYIAYLYILFYVSNFTNDTGGLAFSRAIYQSFTGIYLMEIMLAGLFFLAQNENRVQSAFVEGVLMCVLIGITVAVQFTMRSSFDPLTHYLPIDSEEFPQIDMPASKKPVWAETAIKILNVPGHTDSSDTIRNISHTTIDLPGTTMENAYMHPAFRSPKPVIWIAQDSLGIATGEIEETRASELNLLISSEGAQFNDKGKIKIDGPPPDHVAGSETNSFDDSF